MLPQRLVLELVQPKYTTETCGKSKKALATTLRHKRYMKNVISKMTVSDHALVRIMERSCCKYWNIVVRNFHFIIKAYQYSARLSTLWLNVSWSQQNLYLILFKKQKRDIDCCKFMSFLMKIYNQKCGGNIENIY